MNLHHDEVRKQRSTLAVCPSAKENVCVTDILYEIIEKVPSILKDAGFDYFTVFRERKPEFVRIE